MKSTSRKWTGNIVLVFLALFTGAISFKLFAYQTRHIGKSVANGILKRKRSFHQRRAQAAVESIGEVSMKLVSFNILAPCYKKMKSTNDSHTVMESEYEDVYMDRNRAICDELLKTEADVICLQEYWAESPKIRQLYWETFCGPKGAGYTIRELRRTSHWRTRHDGLAVLVKESRVVLQDSRDILFHDCGDRVAQMLLLAVRPPPNAPPTFPLQQFLCVNTHLLFPHNGKSE
jgi:hypothetical protein